MSGKGLAAAVVLLALTSTVGAGAGPRAKADLLEKRVGATPATVARGASFTVTDVVTNRGAATARASTTRYYLRRGSVSILAGVRRVPALRPHRSSRARTRLTVPAAAPAAAFTLVACVDATGSVAEANERNNCRAARAPLVVTGPVEPPPPTTTTTTTTTTAPADSDHDGFVDSSDCGPHDASVHPGAADTPDLRFVDSNCDGIDGDAAKSIFVSPSGKDTDPGTRERPKRTVEAAVEAAAATREPVLVAAGSYNEGQGVSLQDGVGIYGGYDPSGWSRSATTATVIRGTPQAAFADGDTGVTLQLLTLLSSPVAADGESTYVVRAINHSKLTIERSTLQSVDGRAGRAGEAGLRGVSGSAGVPGQHGFADGGHAGFGGHGGGGAFAGGDGADGGPEGANDGRTGAPGNGPLGGAPGDGGAGGDPGKDGADGGRGGDGANGTPGQGGANGIDLAKVDWLGHDGTTGTGGGAGSGGGGGGGGGGQGCGIFCSDGSGGGGGGGGGAGFGGHAGEPGKAGGGSFGIYLLDSAVTLSSRTTVSVGVGGAGGAGGLGGTGGFGALGGPGGFIQVGVGEIGAGGSGGRGGNGGPGGAGGGGAGGPSIGVLELGNSTVTVGSGVTITQGAAGRGGDLAIGGNRGADGISAAIFRRDH
jgi:hypothetical protein